VTVYLVGLGPVDGNIAAGDPAPGQPPLSTLYPVKVRIGSASVTPAFAGLTPGFAGLYQVNVRFVAPEETLPPVNRNNRSRPRGRPRGRPLGRERSSNQSMRKPAADR